MAQGQDRTALRRVLRLWGFRLVRLVPLVAAAATGLLHFTPVLAWLTRRLADMGPKPNSGVLIVLAAEQHPDGMIGATSYARCAYLASTFTEGRFSRVLITGGASNYVNPELCRGKAAALAEVMGGVLISSGVPQETITVQPFAASTRQSAERSAAILRGDAGPYAVVTSDFHCFRATRCFRRAGIQATSWPVPDVSKRLDSGWGLRWRCGEILVDEVVKIAYYRWKGWI